MVEKPKYEVVFTYKSFNELFEYYTTQTRTYTEAYEKAEEEHENVTGTRRFASYNSFRVCRGKKI